MHISLHYLCLYLCPPAASAASADTRNPISLPLLLTTSVTVCRVVWLPSISFPSEATYAFFFFSATRMPRGIAHISILSIFIANGPFSLISTHKWFRPEHFPAKKIYTQGRRIFKFLCVFITIFMPVSGWAVDSLPLFKRGPFPVPTPPVINWFLCACQLPEMRDAEEKWNNKIIREGKSEWRVPCRVIQL